jgi:hypothetical protein
VALVLQLGEGTDADWQTELGVAGFLEQELAVPHIRLIGRVQPAEYMERLQLLILLTVAAR